MTARKYWSSRKNKSFTHWSEACSAAYLLGFLGNGLYENVCNLVRHFLFIDCFVHRNTITWMRFRVEHRYSERRWWWWGRFIAKFKCIRYMHQIKIKIIVLKRAIWKLHRMQKSWCNENLWTQIMYFWFTQTIRARSWHFSYELNRLRSAHFPCTFYVFFPNPNKKFNSFYIRQFNLYYRIWIFKKKVRKLHYG